MGCHFLPGDLPGPGVKPSSPVLAGRFFTTELQASPINLIFSTQKKKKKKIEEINVKDLVYLLQKICFTIHRIFKALTSYDTGDKEDASVGMHKMG